MRRFLLLFFTSLVITLSQAHSEEAEPVYVGLYQYKPIYFLMGNPYTKIEVSFKANLIRDVPLFFGYNQLMMWDLFISSPFFYDINYDPEAFYRFYLESDHQTWLDYAPFEHESNGKGGIEERSWNRMYARFHTRSRFSDQVFLYWDFKAWVPLYKNPNNSNLDQFRGVWEANFTLAGFFNGYLSRGDLTLRIYPGGRYYTNPVFGGQELTLRTQVGKKVLPLFVGQIFHGYAENLLDYNVNRWGIRAGFGF